MFKYIVIILSMINIFSFNTYSYADEYINDVIKIGVYEYEPYYYI